MLFKSVTSAPEALASLLLYAAAAHRGRRRVLRPQVSFLQLKNRKDDTAAAEDDMEKEKEALDNDWAKAQKEVRAAPEQGLWTQRVMPAVDLNAQRALDR